MPKHNELFVSLMKAKGFARKRDEPFTLASGRKSHLYFDVGAALLDGHCLHQLLPDLRGISQISALSQARDGRLIIGGMDTAARPLVALCTDIYSCPGFILRKQEKGHGTRSAICGTAPEEGDNIFIVEDVITTGGSALQVLEWVRSFRPASIRLLCVLNRQETPQSFWQELDRLRVTYLGELYRKQDFWPEDTE